MDRYSDSEDLAERIQYSDIPANDANACALAEWKWGNGRGCKNMIFLTFGTGLGAGLILNGRLYNGHSGLAGEVGHIRISDHGSICYGKKALGRAIAAVPVLAKCTRTISMNNYPLKRFVGWQNREIKKPCTSSISVLPT